MNKGDNNITITIKRSTGWIGIASKIQIKLNGKKVATVKQNQHIEVEILEDKSNLQVTQLGFLGSKSNKIDVNDRDIIEITSTTFARIINALIVPISFSLGFLIRPITNLKYKLIGFTVFFVLVVISQFFFKMLNIEVVTEEFK